MIYFTKRSTASAETKRKHSVLQLRVNETCRSLPYTGKKTAAGKTEKTHTQNNQSMNYNNNISIIQ